MRRRLYESEELTDESRSSTREEVVVPKIRNGKIVKTSYLNMRSIPSKNGEVVRVLEHGAQIEILKKLDKEQYYKIRAFGSVGYIPFEYCEEL